MTRLEHEVQNAYCDISETRLVLAAYRQNRPERDKLNPAQQEKLDRWEQELFALEIDIEASGLLPD